MFFDELAGLGRAGAVGGVDSGQAHGAVGVLGDIFADKIVVAFDAEQIAFETQHEGAIDQSSDGSVQSFAEVGVLLVGPGG